MKLSFKSLINVEEIKGVYDIFYAFRMFLIRFQNNFLFCLMGFFVLFLFFVSF
jgi:hypothetical protein